MSRALSLVLMIPECDLCRISSTSALSDSGMIILSPLNMIPLYVLNSSLIFQYGIVGSGKFFLFAEHLTPIGILRYLYLLNGVLKVVKYELFSVSFY